MSIFVDTGAWYASMLPNDPDHQRVVEFPRNNSLPLITTDYVVDETLTLLRSRREDSKAIALGRQFYDLDTFNVVFLTPEMILKAWRVYRDQSQRRWSFTDCTSKVLMDDLHIRKALSLDKHFAEFGAIEVLP